MRVGLCVNVVDVASEICTRGVVSFPDVSECRSASDFGPCCPTGGPHGGVFNIWRERQAFDALLLRRIITCYPATASSPYLDFSLGSAPISAHYPRPVRAGLTVFRIFGINQRSQTFQMHYRLKLAWRDCRLLNNCSWMEVSSNHRSYKDIWSPPWRIEEEEGTEGDMASGKIVFSPEGLVFMTQDRVSRLRCPLSLTEMPFDKQRCNITLLMPIDVAQNMNFTLLREDFTGDVVSILNLANAEWEIGGPSAWTAEELTLRRELFNMENDVSALRWSFQLDRRPRSLLMNFVFPAILFYFVSWLGLWIDPAAVPARAAIGVVPVLIMTNKLNSLGKVMPPISYSVKLENFLIATLVFIVLQMLEFGFVNYGLRRAKAIKEQQSKQMEKVVSEALPEDAPTAAGAKSVRNLQVGAKQALGAPDRIAVMLGGYTDIHFRWLSILAYLITTLSILFG